MSSALKDSANNIFVTTATILDKLTYKLSGNATNTVVPHNSSSVARPLTLALKRDFERYNQVLDDHTLDLKETEFVLRYLKAKSAKEEERKKIQQEEAQMKKKIEEEAVRKKQELEQRQTEMFKQQQSKQDTGDMFGSADDLMNLDLDNFQSDFLDFGQQSTDQQPQNDDMMKDLFDLEGEGGNGGGEGAMDSLTDLNLDFLDQPAPPQPQPQPQQQQQAPPQEDDSGLMPTDQMENLFSQFDELTRVLGEEVTRSDQQSDRLGRHQWEVFWSREVRDTKGVEEQNVGVLNVLGTVADPFSHTSDTVTRPLWNMVSRWIQSVVFWWTLGRNDLVGWVLSRVRVDFVRVEDIPGSTGRRLVVRERVLDGLEGGSLGVETVTVHVLWRTGWVWRWLGVCGGSRVSVSVDSRVDSQREQVLVVMGVHVRIHSGTPWAGLLVVAQNVGVQYTSELDVESDGSVLHEHPVQAVLVVGSSEDLGNDQLGGSGDQRGSKVVSEVGVLEQQSVVLLVDTNSVLDGDWVSCSVGKVSVQVVDHTFTVAAKSQWVGHVTGTIFTDIQSVLSLVREVWTSVRNNHLGERHSVENRSHVAMVVVRNVRQDNTFSVVETNVELEVGPFHHVSGHLERNTFWLGHVDRRSLWSHGSNLLFHVLRIEVGVLVLGHLSSSVWNVDVDHLLFLGVNDRTEIQRMRVLRVVLVGSVVNKGLLQSLTNTPSLIVSDGPWVTVNLVHLAGWNTRQNTLLNHSRVVSDNVFGGTQILNGQNRLNLFKSSCLQNR